MYFYKNSAKKHKKNSIKCNFDNIYPSQQICIIHKPSMALFLNSPIYNIIRCNDFSNFHVNKSQTSESGKYKCYEGVGVELDIEVDLDVDLFYTNDCDTQLERALEYIENGN